MKIVLCKRTLDADMSGLDELEVGAVVKMVEEGIRRAAESTETVDSSKLALYACLGLASELYKLRAAQEQEDAAIARTAEKLREAAGGRDD